MRPLVMAAVLGLGMSVASCKKTTPREAPDHDGRAATTEPVAQTPARAAHSRSYAGARLSEDDLFRFVTVSKQVTTAMKSAGRTFEASPEGFLALDAAVPGDAVVDPVLSEAQMTPADWSKLGARAWAAWSVAQVDYNAEATLRDNQQRLVNARRRISTAEASLQTGRAGVER